MVDWIRKKAPAQRTTAPGARSVRVVATDDDADVPVGELITSGQGQGQPVKRGRGRPPGAKNKPKPHLTRDEILDKDLGRYLAKLRTEDPDKHAALMVRHMLGSEPERDILAEFITTSKRLEEIFGHPILGQQNAHKELKELAAHAMKIALEEWQRRQPPTSATPSTPTPTPTDVEDMPPSFRIPHSCVSKIDSEKPEP